MNNLEYSMVDVMLTILKYSKGHWTPDEVLEFAYLLEEVNAEEVAEGEGVKPQLISLRGGRDNDKETTE